MGEPLNKLVLCIVKDATKLGAEGILLELDLESFLKAQKESQAVREKYKRPSFCEAIFKKRFKDYFRFENSSFGKLNIEKMGF